MMKHLQATVLLAAAVILLCRHALPAQSLDSLVSEAVLHNPKLQALQSGVSAAQYRVEAIDHLPPPTLSVEFNQVPFGEWDVVNKSISNTIGLSQMFPAGGKLGAMAEVERQTAAAAGDSFDAFKLELTGRVKMQYYTIWTADRRMAIQRENISLLEHLMKSLELSYSTGRVSQADLLSLKSEIASNRSQLVILENRRDADVRLLNDLLGRPILSGFAGTPEDIPSDTLSMSDSALTETMLDRNPDLRRMNSMAGMNRAMMTANNREMIPDVMVQAMYMRMPQGMILTASSDLTMLSPKVENMYSLMFSFTLPFAPWSAGRISRRDQELSASLARTEFERSSMQRDMTAKLGEAVIKYRTAVDLVSLYSKEVIPLTVAAAGGQLTAYQNGRTGISALIDSYRMLLMQQMNLYMARGDVRMALAEIEMMVGTKLIK